MKELLNAMAAQSQRALGGKMFTRLGTVTSYDPNNYCIKAIIEPEGVETGWIPVTSAWVGNGWGLFCPPTSGDLVELQFQEGDMQAAIACSRFFTDQSRPLTVQSGELWLVHQSGSYFKLLNTGKISMHSTAEIDIGNLENSIHALITDAFVSLFNSHTHGGGPVPNQTMNSSHTTSVLKAN